MSLEIGQKVLSNSDIVDIPWNTEGVIKYVHIERSPVLYKVYFEIEDKVRYLYDHEFIVLEGDKMTKTWVMADNIEESSYYFTANKWYEVKRLNKLSDGGMIIADDGDEMIIAFESSCHVKGMKGWNVHYGDTPPNNRLESSTMRLESSTSDFNGNGDTEVVGEVENVSNQFLELLKDLKEGEFYHPSDLTDFIEGLESGKYTILYNKDLTK
jgi:hypothetical protein